MLLYIFYMMYPVTFIDKIIFEFVKMILKIVFKIIFVEAYELNEFIAKLLDFLLGACSLVGLDIRRKPTRALILCEL